MVMLKNFCDPPSNTTFPSSPDAHLLQHPYLSFLPLVVPPFSPQVKEAPRPREGSHTHTHTHTHTHCKTHSGILGFDLQKRVGSQCFGIQEPNFFFFILKFSQVLLQIPDTELGALREHSCCGKKMPSEGSHSLSK